MNELFSPEDGSILVRLLIAHCLTDFLLQPRYWVENKNRLSWKSPYLWYHGLLAGTLTWLAMFDMKAWWLAIILSLSHILIDGLKLTAMKRTAGKKNRDFLLFTIDQFLHVVVIVLLWLQWINEWQTMEVLLDRMLSGYQLLLKILGYLIVTGPVGFFIHFLTRRWTQDLNMQDSLKDAGRWIGMLERVLIITFIYTNQFSAIGFLIAAKSVLRVTDRPEQPADRPFSTRKHTEYVLIGTFLSFAIAIITGLLINWLSNTAFD